MNIYYVLAFFLISCICASGIYEETKDIDSNESKKDFAESPIELNVNSSTPIGDSTSYLLWYMTPKLVREEITRHLFKHAEVRTTSSAIQLNEQLEDRDRIIAPAEFLRQVDREDDWIRLAEKYLSKGRGYNLQSQLNLLVEIFKNATPKDIYALLDSPKLMISFHLENIPHSRIVEMITESRSSGEDITQILSIMEHRFKKFKISEPDHLQLIRNAAFRLDDCKLMEYTDSFPGLIPASYTCQREFVDLCLIGEKIPELWDMFCRKSSANNACQVKSRDQFVKFRFFDAPVNTKGWHPCMWAIACQDFERAEKIPMKLVKNSSGQIPPAAEGSISIQQLIQMIPDDKHRDNICKKFKCEAKVIIPAEKISSFSATACDGRQTQIQVLENKNQSGAAIVVDPSPSSLDTEAFVLSLLNELYY